MGKNKELKLRVGFIGTGAISHKHAQAYKNIGYEVTVCTDVYEPAGRKFAEQYGCEFVKTYEELCAKGVEFAKPPKKESWGTAAIMKDSEGNQIVLSSS